MLIQIEVNEDEVLGYLRDAFDKRITMEMVMTHVMSGRDLPLDLYKWGVGDTEVMERCACALSKALTGLPWPLNRDSQEIKDAHESKWNQIMEKNGP